ncbi:MAG: hypothetical protein WA446_07340 [Steroidobacteraceae bacterium]
MKRRAFLTSLVAVCAGIAGWRFVTGSQENSIVLILHKRLGYLQLDPAGVEQFARDYVATKMLSNAKVRVIFSNFKLRVIDELAPLYTRAALLPAGKLSRLMSTGEERVATEYLLASDFFTNGADQKRLIKYTGLYDPMRACGNPFARSGPGVDYPDARTQS